MKVAVNNAPINPLLFAHNASSPPTLSSTVHAYHPVPPTLFSSAANASNALTTVSNARQELHVPNVHHYTTFMKENVTLTAIRYLSNTMSREMLAFSVLQDVILVQIMCVILVWKGIRRMTLSV